MRETHQFFTRDLGFVGYLVINNQEILRTEVQGDSIFFYFKNKEICERLKTEYHDEDGQAPAKRYHQIMHDLKGRVWNIKNGN